MGLRAARPCRECSSLAVRDGLCAIHDARANERERERKTDDVAKLYGTARWRKGTRPAVLARDLLCTDCGHRLSTDVDHVERARLIVAKYGVNEFFNPARCAGLCHSCHSKKTSTEVR
jgi:5-methylcytosine-specific restriction endonuclease McrA